jgi:hypothetical protein
MSQPIDIPKLLDPLGVWRQSQDAMFETWSKAMVDFVNTEAYAAMSGRMLDAYLTLMAPVRKAMEQTMTPLLGQMNLPSRAEVASLADRMTHIEMRLDDLDARLDAITRLLQRTTDALAAANSARTDGAATSGSPQAQTQPDAKPSRRTASATAPTPSRRATSGNSSRANSSRGRSTSRRELTQASEESMSLPALDGRTRGTGEGL